MFYSGDIEWPDDEGTLSNDAVSFICALLTKDPVVRLGSQGSKEVKDHEFFLTLDWKGLLRRKAEFVPQLQDDEDTSYFESRADRYYHDDGADGSDEDEGSCESSGSSLFHSFSSSSPRYSRMCSLSMDVVSNLIIFYL